MKTMSLKNAFWQCLKRVGTAEKNENIVSRACIVTGCEPIGTAEKNENKDCKWCILVVFETIWNFYVKACGCSPLTPIGLQFL